MFNSVPFFSGEQTTGYKYNFMPYSWIASLGRPTTVGITGNMQTMTCNADGTRNKSI